MNLQSSWRSAVAAAVIPFLAVACNQSQQPTAAAGAEETAQAYETGGDTEIVTNIQQTMAWLLDPAADLIWDSAGTIITAQGQEDLSPTTEEGWTAVVHAAATLAETGNLLMMPGRSAGEDWDEYSRGLLAAGKLAIKAAQEQDADALFDAGGRIYQVCKACHNQYWVADGDEALQ